MIINDKLLFDQSTLGSYQLVTQSTVLRLLVSDLRIDVDDTLLKLNVFSSLFRMVHT
jgi:hypothetical protein